MSTAPSVADAKKQLRQARLAEHLKNLTNAIAKSDFDAIAKHASGFVALYRNKQKQGKK